MKRPTRNALLIVAAVLLLLCLSAFLCSKAPPRAARLLPESDGIVYINLKPLRALFHRDLKPPDRAPEYQQFIDATGVDWERDLNQVAISLHRMTDPNGPNGAVAYSMVLVGKFNSQRLNAWLGGHAASRETYAGRVIYSIPSEGRTVRVTQIGSEMVAVSNAPTPEQIHAIVDRHRTAALPFSGSSLLERYYRNVPRFSAAWGIGQIGLPFSEGGLIKIFGLSLPFQDNSTIIASVAPALPAERSLRLRVEEIAPSEDKAASEAAALATFITMARGFNVSLGDNTADNALKQLLKSAEVSQHGKHVVVKATLSPGGS